MKFTRNASAVNKEKNMAKKDSADYFTYFVLFRLRNGLGLTISNSLIHHFLPRKLIALSGNTFHGAWSLFLTDRSMKEFYKFCFHFNFDNASDYTAPTNHTCCY